MTKNNLHKKVVRQDNFRERWCCSSGNHPEGWTWWKRKNRKKTRRRMERCMNMNNQVYVDYSTAVECQNPEAWFTCYKCGKCGRRFENGIMVDDGGTHPEMEEED